MIKGGEDILASHINGIRRPFSFRNWFHGRKVKGFASGAGGSSCWDGRNYIYHIPGLGSGGIYRYDINLDTWTALAVSANTITGGGGLVYDGDHYLYCLRGSATGTLLRYDINTNTWFAGLTAIPETINVTEITAMEFDGEDWIYCLTGDSNKFYRYKISTDAWQQLGNTVFAGTSANRFALFQVKDNQDLTGEHIAYRIANNSPFAKIEKYDSSTNSWANLKTLSFPGSAGMGLISDNGDLLYIIGGGGVDRWKKYSVSANTITDLRNLPNSQGTGASIVFVPPGYIYLITGALGAVYRYVI